MLINELKSNIESGVVSSDMIVFVIQDNNFVPMQYIREIAKLHNSSILPIDELPSTKSSMFITNSEDSIKVFETDKLDKFINKNNLYIITKKIDTSVQELYKNFIVDVPKLEQWQIKDYVFSQATGVDEKYLTRLCEICQHDIYRLNNEIAKLNIFDEKERNIVFHKMIDDGMFSDLSKHNMFDLTNAIMRRDINTIRLLYRQLDNIDCEPLGLVTTLYNNFKNVINIQLGNNPTASSCGLTDKQFYAIKKYNCGYYTPKQLIDIFKLLTSIDKRIKTGEIFTDAKLTDYIICHIINI